MSQIAGFINKKIVAFTGNASTRGFVGRAVEPKKSNGKPVYLIDGTGYILTPEEFSMFVKEGIIDRPRAARPAKVDIFGNSEQFYEESDFFKGPVKFEMDVPRHVEVLGFTEGISEKVSGFFDRLGFNAKEKIVASLKD